VDSSSCLVTFQRPEDAAAAAVADLGLELLLTPWKDYAAAKYSCRLPEELDGATAMDVAPPGTAAAGPAAAAAGRGGAGSSRRPAKRPRVAMEAEGPSEEAQQQQRSSCSIM
jgi:hypothetical protein